MKKIFSLCLALLCVLCLFTACGQTEKEEPVPVSISLAGM